MKKKKSPFKVKDAAVGPSKAQRAFGAEGANSGLKGKKKSKRVASDTRNVNVGGTYNGRRGGYQRYSASPMAEDVITKKIKRYK
jgi:hypothetical protein